MSDRTNISWRDTGGFDSTANIDSPSILDVTPCPAKVNGAVSNVLKNSKQPEKMSNAYELFKYCTDPSGLPGVMRILLDGK